MQPHPHRQVAPGELRGRIARLSSLPLRPALVRWIFADASRALDELPESWEEHPKFQTLAAIDPGWLDSKVRRGRVRNPLEVIAGSSWWLEPSSAANAALNRLWRHSVATSLAARRLARELGDPEPERVAAAALLHGLGRWAAAAADPEWFARWMFEADARVRREREIRTLGRELSTVGRELAERWGYDPLIADAAWLHADGEGLRGAASEPDRLAIVQQSYRLAERTPWSMSPIPPETVPGGGDPRLRLLIAEVQVQCAAAFADPDATIHEERLARSHATLRRRLLDAQAAQAATGRFLGALTRSDPSDEPRDWAERAALAWCEQPGVSAARVVWLRESEPEGPAPAIGAGPRHTPPALVLPLLERGNPCAEVQLWVADGDLMPELRAELEALLPCWQSWASLVADRLRLERRLEGAVRAHRDGADRDEERTRREKLEALAEFAAGAGHELNNPLAVIMGRAQLLLAKAADPSSARSLRAIIGQAQRAHRILRDLMYVARPSTPRPRFSQPEEILRSSVRDLGGDAEAREVRLVLEGRELCNKVWADPDALRHLADCLLRNAIEAAPRGGTVRVTASGDEKALRWTIRDNGRGISADEGPHVFDPFYCGRQAGRGLGLGLPRAARIVAQVGGELRWHSSPGQGTAFHVHLPLAEPPPPPRAADPSKNSAAAAERPRDA